MFDTYLRNLKDRIGQPLARIMPKIDPIFITMIGLAFGLGAAVLARFGFYLWALVFWLVNRLLDGLDGLVARMHAKQGDLGGFLDIIVDIIVYAALPIGLVMSDSTPGRLEALSGMLAVYYVNVASWMYLSAILVKRSVWNPKLTTTIEMPAGLIGGFETILFYCAFLIFPAHMRILFMSFTMLIIFSIIQRLVWAVKHLD